MSVHVLMRDEKEERKKQARSNKQTNKAKQHSTPKAVTCTCTYMYINYVCVFEVLLQVSSEGLIALSKGVSAKVLKVHVYAILYMCTLYMCNYRHACTCTLYMYIQCRRIAH